MVGSWLDSEARTKPKGKSAEVRMPLAACHLDRQSAIISGKVQL